MKEESFDIYQAFHQALLPYYDGIKEEVDKKLSSYEEEFTKMFERVLHSKIGAYVNHAIDARLTETYLSLIKGKVELWLQDHFEKVVFPEVDFRMREIARKKSTIKDFFENLINEAAEKLAKKAMFTEEIEKYLNDKRREILEDWELLDAFKDRLQDEVEGFIYSLRRDF